jgi:hypothetical protein
MLNLTYTATDRIASETRYTDLTGINKIGSMTMTYDAVGRLTNLQHYNSSMTILAGVLTQAESDRELCAIFRRFGEKPDNRRRSVFLHYR